MEIEILKTSEGAKWGISPEEKPCNSAIKKEGKWVIEVNNINEILNFIKENEQVIFYCREEEERYIAEIYDTWREGG